MGFLRSRLILGKTSLRNVVGGMVGMIGLSCIGPAEADQTHSDVESRSTFDPLVAATRLYQQGLDEMTKGNYEIACPKLTASLRYTPEKLGTLYTLAFCESRWGHLATADRLLAEYLTRFNSLPLEAQTVQTRLKRPAKALAERARIAPEMAKISVFVVPEDAQWTKIIVNSAVLDRRNIGVAIPQDPGDYMVVLTLRNGSRKEQNITLKKGEHKVVRFEIPKSGGVPTNFTRVDGRADQPSHVPRRADRPIKPPGSEAKSGKKFDMGEHVQARSPLEIGAMVGSILGPLTLVTGGVLGGLANSQREVVRANCGQAIDKSDPSTCNTTGLSASQDLKHLAVGSNIAFIAGGIALAAGVTMYILAPNSSDPKTPQAGKRPRPSLQAGILSTTPTRLVVGAQGSF